MAQEPPPITQPYDGPLRWLVPSFTTKGVTYLVDLGAHQCRGECACDDWMGRCSPVIREGGRLQCKHFAVAYEMFGRWMAPVMNSLDANEPD